MSANDFEAWREALQARFTALQDAYQQLDAEADAQIVRWRYATKSAFDLRVDYHRRFNEKIGTLLDDEPAYERHYYAYGYDTQDRVVYAAFFYTEEMPRGAHYYRYGKHWIEEVVFHLVHHTEDYRLSQVARLEQDTDGKPVRYTAYNVYSTPAFGGELYTYDAENRLARVDAFWQESEQIARSEYSYLYEYEGDTLKRIYMPTPDGDRLCYAQPNPDGTYDMLFEAARLNLYAYVLCFLRQQQISRRIYMLELYFDAVAGDNLSLVVGGQTQRKEWLRYTDNRTYRDLIDAIDARVEGNFLILPSPLPASYDRFVRVMRYADNWEAIRTLHYQVAQALNRADWEGILNITDDFIVYASDYLTMQSPSLHAQLHASVPPDKLQKLRAKGWDVD
jgi:hypothetical protein